MPEIVTAALVREGQVLLVHRSPNRHVYPDVWDLPGGHIDAGETELAALAREMHEELGVQCRPDTGYRVLHPASPQAGKSTLRVTTAVVDRHQPGHQLLFGQQDPVWPASSVQNEEFDHSVACPVGVPDCYQGTVDAHLPSLRRQLDHHFRAPASQSCVASRRSP
ncbi:NUDIX hydrolase [Plantactinospora sp. CA-294935]|uniref:NUDIX hydrolase n=1 Tax=Plantactinospora sp. CA-294935 TaxID=3240012 RepID=UPI003D91E95F